MDLFVTGTDTDIGKTFITAGLAATFQLLGRKTAVFKPVQSGAELENNELIAPDLEYVKSVEPKIITKASYLLKPPVTPELAAEIDEVEFDLEKIINDYNILKSSSDIVLTEGAGGIMVPVAKNLLMIDIAEKLDQPVVIVARPDLGTINHVLLTLNALKERNLKVLGVIINKYPEFTNDEAIKTAPRFIEEYSDAKVIGIVKDFGTQKSIHKDVLIHHFLENVDIQKLLY